MVMIAEISRLHVLLIQKVTKERFLTEGFLIYISRGSILKGYNVRPLGMLILLA